MRRSPRNVLWITPHPRHGSRRGAFLLLALVALPFLGSSGQQPIRVGASVVERLAPDIEFGRIISAVMGPTGRMCLLDDVDVKVRCFDTAGRLLWEYGRKGDGPGELRAVYRISVAPNGSAFVADVATGSMHHLSADGKYLGRGRMPFGIGQLNTVLAVSSDTFVVAATTYSAGASGTNGLYVLTGDPLALLRAFGRLPESRNAQKLSIYGSGSVTLTRRGTLLYALRFPNLIQEYSIRGELLRQVASPYPTRGPDDEFDVSYEGAGMRVSNMAPKQGSFAVGPARELPSGSWWVVRTIAGVGQVLDRVNPVTNRWAKPVPLPPWPARFSVFGHDPASGLFFAYTTCDDEPCLVRFPLVLLDASNP